MIEFEPKLRLEEKIKKLIMLDSSDDFYIDVDIDEINQSSISLINQYPNLKFKCYSRIEKFLEKKKEFGEINNSNFSLEIYQGMVDEEIVRSLPSNVNITFFNTTYNLKFPCDFLSLKKYLESYNECFTLKDMVHGEEIIKLRINNIDEFHIFLKILMMVKEYDFDNRVFALELSEDLFNNNQNANLLLNDETFSELKGTVKGYINYLDDHYQSFDEIISFENYIREIVSNVPADATNIEKVVYVAKILFDNYGVQTSDIEGVCSLYEFINKKVGVCSHYSRFAKRLLNELNIGNNLVIVSHKLHMFNVVTVDDDPSFIDFFWLICEKDMGFITKISQSSNFLSSAQDFGHDGFENDLKEYPCITYDRQKIIAAENEVETWGKQKFFIN